MPSKGLSTLREGTPSRPSHSAALCGRVINAEPRRTPEGRTQRLWVGGRKREQQLSGRRSARGAAQMSEGRYISSPTYLGLLLSLRLLRQMCLVGQTELTLPPPK
jgi:hypothetical protein